MHQCSILPLLKVPPAPGVTSGATYAIAGAGAQMFNEKRKEKESERASDAKRRDCVTSFTRESINRHLFLLLHWCAALLSLSLSLIRILLIFSLDAALLLLVVLYLKSTTLLYRRRRRVGGCCCCCCCYHNRMNNRESCAACLLPT